MKLILSTIYFLVLATVFASAVSNFMCNGMDLSDTAFMNVFSRIPPVAIYHQCLYQCMLKTVGMVKPDGMIMADKFMTFLHISNEYDDMKLMKIAEAVEKCKNRRPLVGDKQGDSCQTVGHFVLCSAEQAQTNGFGVRNMLAAIRLPFFLKDKGDHAPLVW